MLSLSVPFSPAYLCLYLALSFHSRRCSSFPLPPADPASVPLVDVLFPSAVFIGQRRHGARLHYTHIHSTVALLEKSGIEPSRPRTNRSPPSPSSCPFAGTSTTSRFAPVPRGSFFPSPLSPPSSSSSSSSTSSATLLLVPSLYPGLPSSRPFSNPFATKQYELSFFCAVEKRVQAPRRTLSTRGSSGLDF